MATRNPQDSSSKAPLTADEIGAVYKELAAEHVALRARSGAARAALTENIWARIETRAGQASSRAQLQEHAGRATTRRQMVGLGKSGRMWLAAAACVAGALIVGAWTTGGWDNFSGRVVALSHGDGRMHFEVDGTTIGPDDAGRGHLIASESIPVGIRLSDKSQINLQPHTTVRLAALSDGVVITRLSQGTLDVEVVHQEHTNYQFFAGPFLVKVVGTAFRLTYDPQTASMDLKMRTGEVEVMEPNGSSRRVRAGQDVHLSLPAQSVDSLEDLSSMDGSVHNGSSALGDASMERAGSDRGDLRGADREGRNASGQSLRGSVDFHELAAQGRFAQIVQTAQAQGIPSLLDNAPADQLQELAQAARYTGHLALAERVWLRMSARFSGKVSGLNATFFLGRLDEQRGRQASALSRYDTYLRSSPQGVYVQEAWGRKLQLSQKQLGAAAGAQVAQQYLARFPKGPYAATATSILKRVASDKGGETIENRVTPEGRKGQ